MCIQIPPKHFWKAILFWIGVILICSPWNEDPAGAQEPGEAFNATFDLRKGNTVLYVNDWLYREREDLKGEVAVDRQLSLQDLDILLRLADFVVDKRCEAGNRSVAAVALGYFRHQYSMPALLAVIRDESESESLRRYAIAALTQIRDKRMLDFLIEEALLFDAFYSQTMPALGGYVGGPPQLRSVSWRGGVQWPPKNATKEELVEYQKIWLQWWKEARQEFEFGPISVPRPSHQKSPDFPRKNDCFDVFSLAQILHFKRFSLNSLGFSHVLMRWP